MSWKKWYEAYVKLKKICPTCNGRRIIPTPSGDKWQICPLCGGEGYIEES